MGKCSSGGGAGGSSGYKGGVGGSDGAVMQRAIKKQIDDIDAQIDRLKQDNARLLQSDYTGAKNWGKQLEARTKKAAANNKKIDSLEREKKKLQKRNSKSQQSKKKSTTSKSEPKRDKYTGMYSVKVNGKTRYYDSYDKAKAALK